MGRRKSTLSPLWDEKGMEMQTTHPRSKKQKIKKQKIKKHGNQENKIVWQQPRKDQGSEPVWNRIIRLPIFSSYSALEIPRNNG